MSLRCTATWPGLGTAADQTLYKNPVQIMNISECMLSRTVYRFVAVSFFWFTVVC